MSYDLDELERSRKAASPFNIFSKSTQEYLLALFAAAPAMFADLRRLKEENVKLKTIIEKADQYLLTSEWDWKEEPNDES